MACSQVSECIYVSALGVEGLKQLVKSVGGDAENPCNFGLIPYPEHTKVDSGPIADTDDYLLQLQPKLNRGPLLPYAWLLFYDLGLLFRCKEGQQFLSG